MKDLFGLPTVSFIEKPRRCLRQASLRRGPKWETCRTCDHKRGIVYHNRTYYKCALMKETRGAATDIKLKWSACERWKREGEGYKFTDLKEER